MSYLVVDQLENDTPISTKLRFKKSMNIHAVRFYLLKYDTIPDGDLNVQFKIGSDVIGECNLTHTQINTISGTYFHGYVKFDLVNEFRINLNTDVGYTEVDLVFTLSNHTDDPNNYIALVRNNDLFTDEFGTRNLNNPDDIMWENAYGMELYEYL